MRLDKLDLRVGFTEWGSISGDYVMRLDKLDLRVGFTEWG